MANSNAALAQIFEAMARMLDILEQNPHRIQAYRAAAATLRQLPEPIEDIYQRGELATLPGFGEVLRAKVAEYIMTGRISAYEKLKDQVPVGLLDVMQIPGVGPRRARQLWHELFITSLEELEAAARFGELRRLKGFGARLEQHILEQAAQLQRRRGGKVPLSVALPLAQDLCAALQRFPTVTRAAIVGSLRRGCETVGNIDLLAETDAPDLVLAQCRTLPLIGEAIVNTVDTLQAYTKDGPIVTLRCVPPERWGAALQYYTGSQAHNIRLRQIAAQMGLEFGPEGLRCAKGPLLCAEEEHVYASLGLPWIPPELREDRGEIAAARDQRLPHLVTRADLRGDFQCHTTLSDGDADIETMARAAEAQGLTYLVISDHAQALTQRFGHPEAAAQALKARVAEVNARLTSLRVLAGVEVDIQADGRLDWPDSALAGLDVVIAGLHSDLGSSREELTARLIQATRHPLVDIIAHPLGRIFGRREPIDLDVEALYHSAAKHGVALEISAKPSRLDLDDLYARRAAVLGIPLAISSDAHDPEGFAALTYGILIARRAWMEPHHLLNTRTLEDVLAWQAARRQRRGSA